jgi:hypothetical protein
VSDVSSTAYESATLLIRLYELRREPAMREARAWFAREFHPSSADEILQAISGPDSAKFRMVSSYWDMAASFVVNGAIDEKMFNDANGEQLVVWSKIEPYIHDYRAKMGNPAYLGSLEAVVMKRPGAREAMAALRERLKPRS